MWIVFGLVVVAVVIAVFIVGVATLPTVDHSSPPVAKPRPEPPVRPYSPIPDMIVIFGIIALLLAFLFGYQNGVVEFFNDAMSRPPGSGQEQRVWR